MLRSRLLLRIAALCLVGVAGCHSAEEAKDPSSRAETTSADSRAFPADDARTALNAASHGLKSCRVEGGPSVVDAAVKFDPTGRVSKVDVTPEAEPVASCVKTKLAEVAVMPFEGQAVTMTTRVRL